MKSITIAALLLTVSAAAFAAGPSFDCAKASSNVEKMICGNDQLQKLDVALSKNYKSMMAVSDDLPGGAQDLRQEQKAWVAKRNKCTTEKCLVDLYSARVDEVCDAPMIRGVHPDCIASSDVK
jgi:uncharacterized protein